MLTPTEQEEIRQLVDDELADIETQCACAGSYRYLCEVDHYRILTHHPVGRVLRTISPTPIVLPTEEEPHVQDPAGCDDPGVSPGHHHS